MGPGGKIRGSCGGKSDGEGKPKCLPAKKAYALGKKGRASAARRKRRKDPKPNRQRGGEGKRVDPGGARIIKKKKIFYQTARTVKERFRRTRFRRLGSGKDHKSGRLFEFCKTLYGIRNDFIK